MRAHRCSIFLLAVFLFNSPDYSEGQPSPPISISDPRVFRPRTPSEIKTVEDAMAAIITITTQDLGLPTVKPLYLHLYKDTNEFAANAGRYGRRLPAATVKFAAAVAEENRFHVNLEKLRGQPWSASISILAHEYAHNIEYVFSSAHAGPQWIREGFAEWVAAKVLDRLNWVDYALALQRARLEVQRKISSLPQLSELEESARWSVWADGPAGKIHTYRLAFLAVDKLVERGGVSGMQKFFSTENFTNVFGVSWKEFEKDFRDSLTEGQFRGVTSITADKPEWKIGYRWSYDWKSPGGRGTLIRTIDREEMIDGLLAYVVQIGTNADFVSGETLGLIATASKDGFLTKRKGPHEFFSWPLASGKEWKTNFFLENIARKTSGNLTYVKIISSVDDVTVPAGTFQAFKIDTYEAERGALVSEQWYAPDARWFVKTRAYLQDGVREDELTKFNFDARQ